MSLTASGVYVALLGTLLIHLTGLSDACANESAGMLIQIAPSLIGGALSLVGRYRLGGVNLLGLRNL